jgi:hypothetical protein
MLIPLTCNYCQSVFHREHRNIRRDNNSKRKHYCSKECENNSHRKPKIEKPCSFCGKPVFRTSINNKSGNVFCSTSCTAKFNNIYHRRLPSSTCKLCGKPNTSSRTYCSSCWKRKNKADAFANITLLSLRQVTGRPHYQVYANIRIYSRSIYKTIHGKVNCLYCGYDKHVEICHIKSIGDFPDSALVSDVNSPDNLVALCPNHHWEFDKNIITIEDIKNSPFFTLK